MFSIKNSEYGQGKPQSQTVDKTMSPRRRTMDLGGGVDYMAPSNRYKKLTNRNKFCY